MKTKLKTTDPEFFGQEKIGKVLLIIAPPVMLAQLIQALYNIVDSFFVGRFSDDALTAITVIYPIQLIIVALAVGTGVGVNTYMAKKYAMGQEEKANARREPAWFWHCVRGFCSHRFRISSCRRM